MHEAEKEERLQIFKRRCKELDLSSTLQRRLILDAVLDLDDHPTADQVYEAVVDRTPGISRTTVYRTLETLVRTGVITKTCHTGKADPAYGEGVAGALGIATNEVT